MWVKLLQLLKAKQILYGFGNFVTSLTSRWSLSLAPIQSIQAHRIYFRPVVLILWTGLIFYQVKSCQNKKIEKGKATIADLNARNKILSEAFTLTKKRENILRDSIIKLQNQYVQELTSIDAIPIPQLQRSVDSLVGQYFNRYYIGELESAKPKY
jgi:hypothetical protein